MKRKRHSPEQIFTKLREADAILAAGATIAGILQRLKLAEHRVHAHSTPSAEGRSAVPTTLLRAIPATK